MASLDGPKAEARRAARERRRTVADAAPLASERIVAHLLSLPEVRAAGTVALYHALPGEVDPSGAARALHRRGATTLLPRVAGDGLELSAAVPEEELAPGFGGVGEPVGPPHRGEVDVVVVPGLAFTPAGERLGQGGGHYDRLLARLPERTLRVALAFAVQVVDSLPTGPLDEPVDVLVTEDGASRTGARRTSRSDD